MNKAQLDNLEIQAKALEIQADLLNLHFLILLLLGVGLYLFLDVLMSAYFKLKKGK